MPPATDDGGDDDDDQRPTRTFILIFLDSFVFNDFNWSVVRWWTKEILAETNSFLIFVWLWAMPEFSLHSVDSWWRCSTNLHRLNLFKVEQLFSRLQFINLFSWNCLTWTVKSLIAYRILFDNCSHRFGFHSMNRCTHLYTSWWPNLISAAKNISLSLSLMSGTWRAK